MIVRVAQNQHCCSGELHDFLEEDLRSWYPELSENVRITLVEALPSVLPMFSKQLIDYTESTFKEAKIDILTKTMVKEVKEKSVVLQLPDKTIAEVPCGLVVWAAGNTLRKVTRDLMAKFPELQTNRRGITVDGQCLSHEIIRQLTSFCRVLAHGWRHRQHLRHR